MQQSPNPQTGGTQHIAVPDEQILVVKRTTFFQKDVWQGIRKYELESYIDTIKTQGEYIPRASAEIDPTYKQIIPYLIFTHKNRFFLMQRKSTASEQRLRNKLSLGIGGHVNQEDMKGATLFDWAQREFEEEVEYNGTLKIEILGILNDDSNEVGQVHAGLVMMLHGDSDHIQVKSELKSGTLQTLDECIAQIELMESWSKMVLEHVMRSSTV